MSRLECKEWPAMREIVAILEDAMAYTSNGQSWNQPYIVALLFVMPHFNVGVANFFKHVDEASNIARVSFKFVHIGCSPFGSLEDFLETVIVGPTKSTLEEAFVVKDYGKHAQGSIVGGHHKGKDYAFVPLTNGGGDEKSKPLQGVQGGWYGSCQNSELQ